MLITDLLWFQYLPVQCAGEEGSSSTVGAVNTCPPREVSGRSHCCDVLIDLPGPLHCPLCNDLTTCVSLLPSIRWLSVCSSLARCVTVRVCTVFVAHFLCLLHRFTQNKWTKQGALRGSDAPDYITNSSLFSLLRDTPSCARTRDTTLYCLLGFYWCSLGGSGVAPRWDVLRCVNKHLCVPDILY